MTLYFSCLLEWTELLIYIYSLAFLLFFSEMAMTNWLQHLVFHFSSPKSVFVY